jgi:molybdopterin/thiamine biosynthesis adenylyltransferase
MTQPTKALIVGAGGIACTLAPILSRLMNVVIADADHYEPANSSRQFPALKSKGNKAEVLASMIRGNTIWKVQSIPEYVKGLTFLNHEETIGLDLIIGCVDNHASRDILMELADFAGIPAILAANDHEHGEAHLFYPGVYDPRQHFSFEAGEPTPWACNADATLDKYPQTAMANIMASGCAMHILLSLNKASNPLNAIAMSRAEPLAGTTLRVRDMVQNELASQA